MAINPATWQDVEARWRTLSDDEQDLATTFLGDAWALLKNKVRDLETRLDDSTLDPDLVVAVESSMVLRVMRNPDGKASESIDDYSFTRDGATATGGLYLTPNELNTLLPSVARTRSQRLVAYGDFE